MRHLLSTAFLFLVSISFPANVPAQYSATKIQMFEPNLISTSDDELNAAFSPDGKDLYFTKNVTRKGVIVVSHLKNGKWSVPEVAEFSGQFSDFDPYFSTDGNKLFFISNRPLSGKIPKTDFDIWFVEKTKNGWSAPVNVGAPVNSDANELYPAPAVDGTLYFSTDRQGGKGRYDIYRSRTVNGKYTEPENLGEINSSFTEADCYIARDQSWIIFASYGRAEGLGDGDLYISFNRNGNWTKAVNLGAKINSTARDYAPIASPDEKFFYFTSERGFQDSIPAKPFSYAELQTLLKSPANGKGSIYRFEISALNLTNLKNINFAK